MSSPRDNQVRNVVITGASSGIGRRCALHLAEQGFQVFAGVRDARAGQELQELRCERLEPMFIDVTDQASIAAAVRELGSRPLHGLINNAGTALLGPVEFLPVARIREQFEVNYFGQIAVTQAFLPLLRASGGRIVNMSSISGRLAFPFAAPYAGSKYALEAFSDALRRELRRWKISVSIIEPGNVKTAIWDKSFENSRAAQKEFPPAAWELYGEALMKSRRGTSRMAGPDAVSRAVEHALTASRPKHRYVVGRDARYYAMLSLLPDWLVDRFV